MKTFFRIICATCCGFAIFGIGIVLAAIVFPNTDPPDWYGYALIIIPSVIFTLLLVRAINSRRTQSPTEISPIATQSPDMAPLPNDNQDQSNQRITPNSRNEKNDQDTINGADIPDDLSPDNDYTGFMANDVPPQVDSPDFSGSFLHIAGLPLLIGTFCKISHFPNRLEISSPTHKHYLSLDKIEKTTILSYGELIKLYNDLTVTAANSSVFKTLENAIKISAKKKHLSPYTRFFLLAYRDKNAESQFIIFQLNDGNYRDAIKFISSNLAYTRTHVEL